VIKTLLRREDVAPAGVEISVVLCGDPFIQELNRDHRGQDKPTDVLSFPQETIPFAGEGLVPRALGDVVISVDTAERQASAAGWPVASEVALLTVHGVLHLLGYDDDTGEGAAEMRDRAAAVLTDCGIALPPGVHHPYFVQY